MWCYDLCSDSLPLHIGVGSAVYMLAVGPMCESGEFI